MSLEIRNITTRNFLYHYHLDEEKMILSHIVVADTDYWVAHTLSCCGQTIWHNSYEVRTKNDETH